MSSIKNSLIWEIKVLDNQDLTHVLVRLLRTHNLVAKDISSDIAIQTKKVHNWFYRNTGMTAFDLLKLMHKYEFIKEYIFLYIKNK